MGVYLTIALRGGVFALLGFRSLLRLPGARSYAQVDGVQLQPWPQKRPATTQVLNSLPSKCRPLAIAVLNSLPSKCSTLAIAVLHSLPIVCHSLGHQSKLPFPARCPFRLVQRRLAEYPRVEASGGQNQDRAREI